MFFLLELFRIGILEHGWVELAIVILSSSFVSFKQPCELTVEHVEVQLLQAGTVSEVDLVQHALVTHELRVLKAVHQLLEVDLKGVFLVLSQLFLDQPYHFGLFDLCINLQSVHLKLGALQLACFVDVVAFILLCRLLWIFFAQVSYVFVCHTGHTRLESLSFSEAWLGLEGVVLSYSLAHLLENRAWLRYVTLTLGIKHGSQLCWLLDGIEAISRISVEATWWGGRLTTINRGQSIESLDQALALDQLLLRRFQERVEKGLALVLRRLGQLLAVFRLVIFKRS